MRVAIIHYWLVAMRGGERVLEELCNLYPDAVIFTHVYDKEKISETINRHEVRTTFIDKLPFSKKLYTRYLPLMPIALEQIDLTDFDLVISSESGPAKGVIIPPGCKHICYCHTPMRYVWDMYHSYRKSTGFLTRLIMVPVMHYLRLWDQQNNHVDHFIANSQFVADRIKRHYARDAKVIYPPVSVSEFSVAKKVGDYYLCFGQLVDYKRVDIVVKAFNKNGEKLLIIGEGSEEKKLKKLAKSNIHFLGRVPFSKLKNYLSECKALVFPGIEDFGIAPVEVMSSGRPVIAYNKGGAKETVVHGKTGLLFDEQTPESLIAALKEFEICVEKFNSVEIVKHADTFNEVRFREQISEYIKSTI